MQTRWHVRARNTGLWGLTEEEAVMQSKRQCGMAQAGGLMVDGGRAGAGLGI